MVYDIQCLIDDLIIIKNDTKYNQIQVLASRGDERFITKIMIDPKRGVTFLYTESTYEID